MSENISQVAMLKSISSGCVSVPIYIGLWAHTLFFVGKYWFYSPYFLIFHSSIFSFMSGETGVYLNCMNME